MAPGGERGGGRAGGELEALARLHGVQTEYYDVAGRRVVPPAETLVAVLRALGVPLEAPSDVPDVLRAQAREAWRRPLPPAVVAWNGAPARIAIRLPRTRSDDRVLLRIDTEQGESVTRPVDLGTLAATESGEVEGESYVAKSLTLPGGLAAGYHRVTVEGKAGIGEALIIAAPLRAYPLPEGRGGREWGLFIPLYALHSRRSVGSGDLADLEAVMDWVGSLGGTVVGTLPILGAFLSEPFHPSPYSPASRLFWNEFYLDLTDLPGLEESPEAQDLMASPAFEEEARRLREAPLVDYRRAMALKRSVIEAVAHRLLGGPAPPPARFTAFLARNPNVIDYAAFRAEGERTRAPWPAWPAPARDGVLPADAGDGEGRRYHLYAQWAMDEQLGALSSRARERGRSLYLDLPLGVSYDSYDVWRRRDQFVLGVSAGAPPDDFFTKGQDWGFPPLNPERIREDGFAYYRACLRQQLRHAGILRIDHVMGFHRFFWVPGGMDARDGTYVRYPDEEFFAILTLESHRHRAWIVGEDLGTVPPEVRTSMDRHGIARMFVLQFSLSPDPAEALPAVPEGVLASVNTHDTPTFASFREGLDITERAELGHLDGEEVPEERARRRTLIEALVAFLRRRGLLAAGSDDALAVLGPCLAHLGASGAGVVVANLEDLWMERNPQNVPGTWLDRPNWMRKARYALEEFREMPQIAAILGALDRARKGGLTTASPPAHGGDAGRKG